MCLAPGPPSPFMEMRARRERTPSACRGPARRAAPRASAPPTCSVRATVEPLGPPGPRGDRTWPSLRPRCRGPPGLTLTSEPGPHVGPRSPGSGSGRRPAARTALDLGRSTNHRAAFGSADQSARSLARDFPFPPTLTLSAARLLTRLTLVGRMSVSQAEGWKHPCKIGVSA